MTIGYASDGDAAGTARWHRDLAAALGEDIRLWTPTAGWGGAVSPIDIVIVGAANARMFDGLTGLRFIQSSWAGVDSLLAIDLPPGVPISRLVDPTLAGDMADYVVTQVMALHRQLPTYARQQRDRIWRAIDQPAARDRRIGFLGFGEMARASARALAPFGFPVRAWARHGGQIDGVDVGAGDGALRDLLGATDILVNLLPLTEATRGLLNRTTLSLLPRGAMVVNAGRGAHLVLADLVRLLDDGHLQHAILDVFPNEPLGPGDPLWAHPAISITPHVAATTDPASASRIIAANIRRFRSGDAPIGLVDQNRGY